MPDAQMNFSKVSCIVTVRSKSQKPAFELAAGSELAFEKKLKNCTSIFQKLARYGVATVSRIDKITGLFCRISSLLYGSFAKETYNFIDPANGSHPILAAASSELASE